MLWISVPYLDLQALHSQLLTVATLRRRRGPGAGCARCVHSCGRQVWRKQGRAAASIFTAAGSSGGVQGKAAPARLTLRSWGRGKAERPVAAAMH